MAYLLCLITYYNVQCTHTIIAFLSCTTAGDQDGRDDGDKSDVGDGGEEALHSQGLGMEDGDSVPDNTDLGDQPVGDDSPPDSAGLGKYPYTCTCQ